MSHQVDRRTFLAAAAVWGAMGTTGHADQPSKEGTEKMEMPGAITDSHVHFWNQQELRYGWVKGAEVLDRNYLPPDYQEATAGYPVKRVVFVQAECAPEQAEAEARWVDSLADHEPRIEGIVPYAPLHTGAAAEPMVKRLAAMPRVRGIRRLIQGERAPGFALEPAFIEGVRMLADYELAFDIGMRRDQLPDAVKLAERCPKVRFVLNHIGTPDLRTPDLDPWREHITELASLPNMWCKVSGVITAADRRHWSPGAIRPAVEHVLSSFAADKVMFGSDWPVVRLAGEWSEWTDALIEITQGMAKKERHALWSENAGEFYRLSQDNA